MQNPIASLDAECVHPKRSWPVHAGYLALGWTAAGSQTYLLREFLVAAGGNEASIGIGLATWLSGIGLGAIVARSLGYSWAKDVAGAAIALLPPIGFCEFLIAHLGRRLAETAPGELMGIGASLLVAVAVFAFPGILIGAGFVALAARKASNHSSAGIAIERIYVFESLGSLAAGLVLTCVLIPFTSSYAGYCLLLLVAVVLWLPAASRKFIVGYRWLVFEALALAILCAPPVAQRVEAKLQQLRFESLLPHARLLDWDETPYTHLALSQGATHALFSGGSYVLDFPDSYEDEARAHPLMLLAQRPRRILIVGSFEPGMLRYWLEHPVERIDWVSLDERAHTFVLKYLDTTARSAFSAPRMHCRFEDPRTWLQHSSAQFDLILQLEREPATLMLARNSTLEFLHLLGTHLAPGGTLVTRVASGPNVQVGPRALLGASIYSTIGRVLPFVRAVPDPLNVLISGTTSEAVSLEHATIIRRWKERAIPSEIVTPETLVDLFPPERIATLNRELAAAARTATPNTDDRPAAFVHAFALRQQIAGGPGLLALTDFLERPKLVWALVLLPSLLLLGATKFLTPQRRALAAVVHTVTIVGATGMALDLLVLFSFQTYVGALYSELGLLSGLFMLGLALGGHLSRRLATLLHAQAVAACATLLPLLFWATERSLNLTHTAIMLVHGGLLLIGGTTTGLVLPIAADALLQFGQKPRAAASGVEAADHFGAAAAALISSVVLVPVTGLRGTIVLLFVLQMIGLASSVFAARSSP